MNKENNTQESTQEECSMCHQIFSDRIDVEFIITYGVCTGCEKRWGEAAEQD